MKLRIERMLGSPLARRLAVRLRRGRRLILAYHNVLPPGIRSVRADQSLHLEFARFTQQLDALVRGPWEVVPLDAPMPSPGAPPQYCITFDDAYESAVRHALPELSRRGLPATVFVAPGMLGNAAPWWDRLGAATEGGLPARIRTWALETCAGEADKILSGAEAAGLPIAEPEEHCWITTVDGLSAALQSHELLTLAPHSWSHPNLTRVATDQLAIEVERPLQWLRSRWGSRCLAWLAYPYGVADPRVRTMAESTGYDGALIATGGWSSPIKDQDRFLLPRFNVPAGASLEGFVARTTGLLSPR